MTAVVNGHSVVGATVTRLRATFEAGRTRSLTWRRDQLEGLHRLLTERESDIAAALEADLGRNAMGTFMGDIAPVTAEITHTLAELTSWAAPRKVRLPAGQQPGKARVVPTPKGVVLVIGAWNFPILLTLQPAVSALAAGNTVVLKPSELAPATAALLADLLPRYVDPAAVAVVTGDAAVSTSLLAERFDHVFFTGSDRVGRIVLEACAKDLTPATLELGGKSPVIVARDADLDVAARRIAWAKSVNAGQACIAPDYVLVEDAVRPAFVERLLHHIELAGQAEPTRIVSEAHFDRLDGLLSGHGGEVTGGARERATRRFAPAVVTDPDPDSPLMQEEIFGPVLPVIAVPDLASAVRFVVARPHPLALYLFTSSDATVERVQDLTNSGSFCVNHLLYQLLVPDLPFGGVGASGIGSYHGQHGFDTFSHLRAVLQKPTAIDPSFAYPPYGPGAQKLLRRVMG
ncbi:aldehyde dehydrogenase family protein [Pseudonocardia pini]|uniref:aldehyde dehydrogenase family protein n=1 Tax=Pseudonocardia pini TaxID=2758030 RepID=UPI0015F05B29|nr:aldehyde dehydrogenase family protein [Pseudonocardia pini]